MNVGGSGFVIAITASIGLQNSDFSSWIICVVFYFVSAVLLDGMKRNS